MAYPTSITTDTASAGTSLLSSPDHSDRHNVIGSAVIAIETVIGTNSGTSIAKNFTAGKFAARTVGETHGTSTWIGGTIGTAVIGTSTIQGGTANNQVMGSPAITGGTLTSGVINNATLGSPTITGGTANGLTLGTPVINVFDGWANANETWTIVGTAAQVGTIGVPLTANTKYDKGDRLKFTQGGTTAYLVVANPTGTTLVVTGGSDYVLGTGAITSNKYSKVASPNGYPGWFNFTPTWGQLTVGNATNGGRFSVTGQTCFVRYTLTWGNSTSAGAGGGTITSLNLPINITQAEYNTNTMYGLAAAGESGGGLNYVGFILYQGTSSVYFVPREVNTQWSGTSPFTWDTGDTNIGNFNYQI